MRLVDLDDLTLAIEDLNWYHISPEGKLVLGAKSDSEALYKADDIFKVLNSANARPKAHWVEKTHNDGYGDYMLYHCSNCDTPTAQKKIKNYCACCGFKMEGKEE
jgi:hypothetical protein